MYPLEVVSAVVAGAWAVFLVDPRRRFPRRWHLPEPGPAVAGSVAIVVPARNEAALLPLTLPSLLAQEVAGLRVVVADDASDDGTAEAAERAAATTPWSHRLQVAAVPPREAGWSGKLHALASGLQQVGEVEWILLTDADIQHRPGALQSLLTQAERGGYDLVSVMARLRAESFWERLLIPPFVFFFHLLYPFRRVSDPGSSIAAAAGGCVLLRRATLERAGGLAAIHAEIIDDLALARLIHRQGGRLWLGLDPEIVSLRSYPSLRSLWNMVARTAFLQLKTSWARLAATLAALAILVASPPLLVATAAVATTPSAARAAAWGLVAWSLQAAALAPFVRHHRAPTAYAVTLPAAAVLYGLMTWTSAWRHLRGRGARWKGRRYG